MIQYELRPSQTLLIVNIALYLLAATALFAYYQINLTSLMLFFLTILLILHELFQFRQAVNQQPEILSLNLSSGLIERSLVGDNRQFTEYSVYTCRWGILLVLKQSKVRLSMILLADRFNNSHDYLDLRYQVLRLNQDIHAS